MKKILAILALMIMVTILASCGGNKEGSKTEEGKEGSKVQAAEKAISKVAAPVIIPTKKSTKSIDVKTTGSGSKSEKQIVKDFEKELDGLFKLLESNPNAKK